MQNLHLGKSTQSLIGSNGLAHFVSSCLCCNHALTNPLLSVGHVWTGFAGASGACRSVLPVVFALSPVWSRRPGAARSVNQSVASKHVSVLSSHFSEPNWPRVFPGWGNVVCFNGQGPRRQSVSMSEGRSRKWLRGGWGCANRRGALTPFWFTDSFHHCSKHWSICSRLVSMRLMAHTSLLVFSHHDNNEAVFLIYYFWQPYQSCE